MSPSPLLPHAPWAAPAVRLGRAHRPRAQRALYNCHNLLTPVHAVVHCPTHHTAGSGSQHAPNTVLTPTLPLPNASASTPGRAQVLSYHVVPTAAVVSTQLTDGQVLDTLLEGGALNVSLSDGGVKIGDANVVTPNIKAGNNIIHVIDKVLLPAALVKN